MSGETVTRGHGKLEALLARWRAQMANKLLREDLRGGALLDIGCGSFPYFLTNTRFAEKTGIDQVVHEDHVLEHGGESITLRRWDLDRDARLPFGDASFEAVTMLAVFEHIEAGPLVDTVREIRRVLKPGGQYVLTTPAAWSDPILRTMARLNLVSHDEIDEHQDAYTHAAIRRILAQGGFDASETRCGYFELFLNLWVVAKKSGD